MRLVLVLFATLFAVAPAAQPRLLIPFYGFPGVQDAGAYSELRALSDIVPMTVIVNPCSGPIDPEDQSTCPDAKHIEIDYEQHVLATDTLRDNNSTIRILGYIATGYLTGPGAAAEAVRADIDVWASAYDGERRPDGLFFDEGFDQLETAEGLGIYRELCTYARSQGFSYVVLNPGTEITPEYLDDDGCTSAVIFEDYLEGGIDEWATYEMDADLRALGPERLGVLLHDAAGTDAMLNAVEQAVERGFGSVYVTDDIQRPLPGSDTLRNPWDSLATYLVAEAARVAQLAVTSAPRPPATRLTMSSPRPQPADGEVTWMIDLTEAASVQVEVLDVRGRRLARLHDGRLPSGATSFRWGADAAAGVYLITARSGGESISRRLVLR